MMYTPTVIDKLMDCCGVQGAHGFTNVTYVRSEGYKLVTKEQHKEVFNYLDRQAESNERSCTIIFLSSGQKVELEQAQANGFKIVDEFFNPNSGNQVYILTRSRFKTSADYDGEWDETYDDEDD